MIKNNYTNKAMIQTIKSNFPDKKSLHNHSIDFIRVISILAVVLIHTTIRTIQASDNNLSTFIHSFILHQISGFAVPLFFIISGFVLELNYSFHQNYFLYLKKRLTRVVIPYITWSIVYYYFIYPNHSDNLYQAIINGSASYQLYFIPALIAFYLIFPLIHELRRYFDNRYSLMVILLIQGYLLYSDYYLHNLKFYYPLLVAGFNLFAFIFGIVISHHQDKIKKYSSIPAIICLAAYITYEGYSRFYNTQNYLSFYSQWRPSVLIYALLIFAFLYNLNIHSWLIHKLSKLSFLVFFIHIIILETVWKFIGTQYQQWWFDITFFSLVTSASFAVSYIVHRLPKLSHITG